MTDPIFTFGHSDYSTEWLGSLLQAYGVEVLVDVRTSPYSRRSPAYNRHALRKWLRDFGVQYYFGGLALGGRPTSPTLYRNGRANYEQMALQDGFRSALRTVVDISRDRRVGLLCSESNPLECHRFLLVGRALVAQGESVHHVLPSMVSISQEMLLGQLIRSLRLDQSELFRPESDIASLAYAEQSGRVAFSLDQEWRKASALGEME